MIKKISKEHIKCSIYKAIKELTNQDRKKNKINKPCHL